MRLGLAPTVLLLALTGCGGDEPERAVDQGSEPAVDELAEHQGEPCPDVLVDPDDEHGFGTDTPAEESPVLAEQDRAWVCIYDQTQDPDKPLDNGTYFRWRLTDGPTELDDQERSALQSALDGLAPAATDRGCTDDLGSRVMFVTAREGDLTGVVVDLYGCRDVRMTDDPYSNPPGVASQPGTVPGVLSSSALAELAQARQPVR